MRIILFCFLACCTTHLRIPVNQGVKPDTLAWNPELPVAFRNLQQNRKPDLGVAFSTNIHTTSVLFLLIALLIWHISQTFKTHELSIFCVEKFQITCKVIKCHAQILNFSLVVTVRTYIATQCFITVLFFCHMFSINIFLVVRHYPSECHGVDSLGRSWTVQKRVELEIETFSGSARHDSTGGFTSR